jgi:hypothetical protein
MYINDSYHIISTFGENLTQSATNVGSVEDVMLPEGKRTKYGMPARIWRKPFPPVIISSIDV